MTKPSIKRFNFNSKKLTASTLVAVMSLTILACTDDAVRSNNNPDPYGNSTVGTQNGNNGSNTGGTIGNDPSLGSQDIMAGDDVLRQTRVIYFDYDSSQVRQADQEVLKAHARYLRENPQIMVRLEGHADERGSREYNLGLGQNRANSVKQFMMLTGVSGTQLDTISYGEEKPASFGHNESSWAQNRRVEIEY